MFAHFVGRLKIIDIQKRYFFGYKSCSWSIEIAAASLIWLCVFNFGLFVSFKWAIGNCRQDTHQEWMSRRNSAVSHRQFQIATFNCIFSWPKKKWAKHETKAQWATIVRNQGHTHSVWLSLIWADQSKARHTPKKVR